MWASDHSGAGTTRRILIVEDHPDTRTYLALCLQEYGYPVASVSSMQDALRLIKEQRFDILLSDVGLHDGDGWRLLDLAGTARPPYAIAMSGFGTQKDQQKSLAVGYQHHLVKPFSGAALRQVMREAEAFLSVKTQKNPPSPESRMTPGD